jgi:hypothetical protein
MVIRGRINFTCDNMNRPECLAAPSVQYGFSANMQKLSLRLQYVPDQTLRPCGIQAPLPRSICELHVLHNHSIVSVFSAIATDTANIVSACGVRQGDPHGRLLFVLVLQRTLEKVAIAHFVVLPVAYADDNK